MENNRCPYCNSLCIGSTWDTFECFGEQAQSDYPFIRAGGKWFAFCKQCGAQGPRSRSVGPHCLAIDVNADKPQAHPSR